MNNAHPKTRIENGITMIFRGTFLGLPVYSPKITSTNMVTPDATVVVRLTDKTKNMWAAMGAERHNKGE
jgi:hypothetical protein